MRALIPLLGKLFPAPHTGSFSSFGPRVHIFPQEMLSPDFPVAASVHCYPSPSLPGSALTSLLCCCGFYLMSLTRLPPPSPWGQVCLSILGPQQCRTLELPFKWLLTEQGGHASPAPISPTDGTYRAPGWLPQPGLRQGSAHPGARLAWGLAIEAALRGELVFEGCTPSGEPWAFSLYGSSLLLPL